MTEFTKDQLMEALRKSTPEMIAHDILSVQPMDGALDQVFAQSKTPDWLKANGYEPVSSMGLMWRKKPE